MFVISKDVFISLYETLNQDHSQITRFLRIVMTFDEDIELDLFKVLSFTINGEEITEISQMNEILEDADCDYAKLIKEKDSIAKLILSINNNQVEILSTKVTITGQEDFDYDRLNEFFSEINVASEKEEEEI